MQIFFFSFCHSLSIFPDFKTPGKISLLKNTTLVDPKLLTLILYFCFLSFLNPECVVEAEFIVSPSWRLNRLFLQTEFRWRFH